MTTPERSMCPSIPVNPNSLVFKVDSHVPSLLVIHVGGVHELQHVPTRLNEALLDRLFGLTVHVFRLEPTSVFRVHLK